MTDERKVIRIEVAATDPDAWAIETSLAFARAELKRTSRWRVIRRRELFAEIANLEDWLRRNAAARDAEALERTRQLLEAKP